MVTFDAYVLSSLAIELSLKTLVMFENLTYAFSRDELIIV